MHVKTTSNCVSTDGYVSMAVGVLVAGCHLSANQITYIDANFAARGGTRKPDITTVLEQRDDGDRGHAG